ncbi:SpoIIE family protein phosphatase [Micromonospora sp. URMC 103]|uniref:PP2C family protein-serine/threonine phosphatase n=1 Tax=Micromonospora sp. URMC 103 TaxID=3423406 RepID=UPI003F1B6269
MTSARASLRDDEESGAHRVTTADARDVDPGDAGVRARPRPVGAPALPPRDLDRALPPPDLDRASAAADWSEVAAHLREGLVVCDADGTVRHVSPVARRLLPEIAPGRRLSAAGVPALADDPGRAEFVHGSRRLAARVVPLSNGRRCWYVEDVTESVSRGEALAAERARAAYLAVVGEKLGNPLHPDRAAAAVARLAVPTLGAVAVLVLAPRAGRARWWRAVRADDGAPVVDSGVLPGADLPPAIAEGLNGAQPHALDWLVEQAAEAGWLPGLAPGKTDARVVPLPGVEAPAGVLLVARPAGRWYDDADTDLLRGFAARAGAALSAAALYRDQAEVADMLQASLLPVEPVETPGVQWGTAYRPAETGLRIGGDFYGSHRLADGGSLFFLGDVSGKGVDAAVFTGQLRQSLQALHRVESRPGALLGLLNEALLETTQAHGQGRFATLVLGVVRPHRDGGLTLAMAGGGHLPPLVLRASGEVETVAVRGMLIGVVSDPRVGEVTVRLAPGETCVLYSDGVTEARGGPRGDHFGSRRLVEALTDCHRMPAPALAERIEQVTCDWLTHGDHDDIAVLALRAVGARGGRTPRHLHSVPDRAGPA